MACTGQYGPFLAVVCAELWGRGLADKSALTQAQLMTSLPYPSRLTIHRSKEGQKALSCVKLNTPQCHPTEKYIARFVRSNWLQD